VATQIPPPAPTPPANIAAHISQVYLAYTCLLQTATTLTSPAAEGPLGGQLLYVAELDSNASPIIRAASIAGTATLAASSSDLVLRQAQRDGVIDFLVNTLDEALRILKNEIRKRQPVAVAVSVDPRLITQEMMDRGVLPDLLPRSPSPDYDVILAPFLAQGARLLPAPSADPTRKLHIWPIPVAYTNRPAEFEAILETHLSKEDQPAHRWLHLSSRYLDPIARRYRSIPTDPDSAEKLAKRFGPPLKA
jgi:hypothetical protein